MKKIIAFCGAWLYAMIISIIIGTIFLYLSKFVINFSWTALIIFAFVLAPFIYGIVAGFSSLLVMPLLKLIDICKSAKWLPVISFLINGIYCVTIPWNLSVESYGVRQIILAIMLDSFVVSIYISLIQITLTYKSENKV